MKGLSYNHFFAVPLCLWVSGALGQVTFRTIVPPHVILTGESFQVQFVLENAEKTADFLPPQFRGFRVVSGPNIYSGNKPAPYKNVVFTLTAIKEGKFRIHGATCLVNGRLQKSNDVIVKIIPQKESGESSYFLRPGEDPYKKIRENLFLKLILDKRTCFIGEPVVATFKLYSRLQSRSNVIRNPGFYGFSVYDMAGVGDKIHSEEKLREHWFDVHTIREVQLYPLQAGTFTIDAMELSNQVEFYRSVVNKKNEQEISENMYGAGKEMDNHDPAAEVYEMNIKSNPVVVTVNPLPGKNIPDAFAGAVGNFSISAFVEKDSLLKNEEGVLKVNLNGTGNFQRVNEPVIHWPENMEVFAPSVKDTFDKKQVPLKGRRNLKYIFVTDKPGYYQIPSISFSFFDLKTKTFKTVLTDPIPVFISFKSKRNKSRLVPIVPPEPNDKFYLWLIAAAFLTLIATLLHWLRNQRNLKRVEERKQMHEIGNSSISIEEILMPAGTVMDRSDKTFYKELIHAVLNYLHLRLRYPETHMNTMEMPDILAQQGVNQNLIDELTGTISRLEAVIYTNAEMNLDKTEIFETTRKLLAAIEDSFKK